MYLVGFLSYSGLFVLFCLFSTQLTSESSGNVALMEKINAYSKHRGSTLAGEAISGLRGERGSLTGNAGVQVGECVSEVARSRGRMARERPEGWHWECGSLQRDDAAVKSSCWPWRWGMPSGSEGRQAFILFCVNVVPQNNKAQVVEKSSLSSWVCSPLPGP